MRTSSVEDGGPAILSGVIRWTIRLASVLVTALLAYGWGDFATDPGPIEAVILIVLTVMLAAALGRLYRSGGVAAFEWDDEGPRRAPGEPSPQRGPGPDREPPTPAARPAPPRTSGSLWSSKDP
jgi:hypothetical protein